MSNKQLYQNWALTKDTVYMAGTMTSHTSSALGVTGNYGWSATRSQTGEITVSLSELYPVVFGQWVNIVSLTPDSNLVRSTTPTYSATTKIQSFVINTYAITTGTYTAVDLAEGKQISFGLALGNSSQIT